MTAATASAAPARLQIPGRVSPVTVVLAALSVAAMAALTALTIAEGPPAIRAVAQLVLVVSFGALALIDLRAAAAIALIELAVGGASGAWTRFPGGWSGRHVIDALVVLAAIVILYRDWRRMGRLQLGRYAPHALTIAVLIPLIWMPLGLLNGHAPLNVFADGNGHLFFAFTLVFLTLNSRGMGAWLRASLFLACAVNAIVTLLMIVVTAPGWIPLHTVLRPILLGDLDMGGAVGYMSNGAFRLYLGSGIYLQIGLALTVWALLQNPRAWWLWALYTILIVDVIATYTRGFWLGTALAVGLVVLLGARHWRRPLFSAAATLGILALLTGAGSIVGFSLPEYVFSRSASLFEQPDTTPRPGQTGSPQPTPPEGTAVGGGRTADEGGAFSNQVRATQARVLLGHIAERPVFGHGFGAIARDYPYDQIFSYELAFLDLAYKTGLAGVLLYLSYPLRLLADALRGRFGGLTVAPGVSPHELSVVVAILVSVLVVGATNPYILAAFGLMPILITIAWLEPRTA